MWERFLSAIMGPESRLQTAPTSRRLSREIILTASLGSSAKAGKSVFAAKKSG